MDTPGIIRIYVAGGANYDLGVNPHSRFIELYGEMESGNTMLIVKGSKHIALNPAHIISLEWGGK